MISKPPLRWRPNWRAWAVLAVIAIVVGFGVPRLRQWQLQRIADRIRLRAEQAQRRVELAREKNDQVALGQALSEVVKHYDRYLRHRPDDGEIAIRLALAISEQADHALGNAQVQLNAYRVLDRTLARLPDHRGLLRAFGETALRLGRWNEALTAWSHLQELEPEDAEAALKVARCQLARAQIGEAIKTLRNCLAKHQDFLEAYSLLARCYRDDMIRDYEAARAAVDEMVAKNSATAAAYARRAAYWLWVEQTTLNPQEREEAARLARGDAQVALKRDPKDVEALLVAAEISLRENRPNEAHSLLTVATEVAPTDDRVWALMVRWARITGQRSVEENYLQRIVTRNPGRLPELAELYLSLNPPNIAGARDVVQQMQKSWFPAELLQLWRLRLELAEGRVRKVVVPLSTLYRTLVEKNNPLAEQAGLVLAVAYTRSGGADAAGAVLAQLRERFSESPRVRLAWASWLLNQGQVEAAAQELEKLRPELADFAGASRVEFLVASFLAQLALVPGKNPQDPAWKGVEDLWAILQTCEGLDPERRVLLQARWLEAQGKIDEAARTLREFTQERATSVAIGALAEALCRSGKISEALDLLQEAEERKGTEIDLLLAYVRILPLCEPVLQEKIAATVSGKAEKLPQEAKQSILRALLRFYLQQSHWEKAERLAKELLTVNPVDPEYHRVLLEVACARGDFETARKSLDEIRRSESRGGGFSDYGAALLAVAQASQPGMSPSVRQNLLTEAKQHIAAAKRELPLWADLIHLEARVALLEGRLDAAVERLQTLEQRHLLGPQGREELATLLLLQGRDQEAERVLVQAPRGSAQSGFQEAKLRAELWARQGRVEEALQLVEPLIQQSQNPLDWLWWAQWLARAGKQQAADAAFSRARELAPQLPQLVLAEVAYRINTNRKEEARQQLHQLEQTLGKNLLAYRTLAIGYELLDDHSQAERYLRLARQMNPQDADLLLDWAGFCLRRGKFTECRSALETIFSADGQTLSVNEQTLCNARRNLAQLLAASADYRDFQRARALLEQNLEQTREWIDRCLLARILCTRPEKALKQQGVEFFWSLLREGRTLSPEDRFSFARALADLGRWPDARLQMLTLFKELPQPQAPHLVFFIEQMIEHGSPEEEIRPYLRQLADRVGPDAPIVIELELRLALSLATPGRDGSRWREHFEESVQKQDWARAVQWAQLAERAGATTLAAEAWDRLASMSPRMLLLKAGFLARKGQLDAALDACELAISHVPPEDVASTAVNCLRAARTQIQASHLARVEKWLENVKAAELPTKRLGLDYASFLNLSGRQSELPGIYRRLLERTDLSDVEKALVENNLAYILAASAVGTATSGSPSAAALSEAEKLVTHAIQVLGPSGSFLDTRALVRMQQGKLTEALTDARQAVLEDPSPLSYFHLIEALWRVGDKATALRELQRARETLPLTESSLPPVERERFRQLMAVLQGESSK